MPTISRNVWITREGHEFEINKMASSHLLATIHYIERRRFEAASEVYTQAQIDGNDWSDAVSYYLQWPIQYESLVKEAQRRNLIFRNISGLALNPSGAIK